VDVCGSLLFGLGGSQHKLGANPLLELLLVQQTKGDGSLHQSGALLVGLLGALGGVIVTNVGVQGSDQHQRLVHDGVDLLLVSLNTDDAVLGERDTGIRQQTDRLDGVLDHDGLEDVQLKVTVGASNTDSGVVTHNLGADHGHGLALGRVDLSGHDGRTGLVLGQVKLSETATRARSQEADIVGNLHQGNSQDVQGTVGLDDSIVGSKGLKLVGGSLERELGNARDSLGDLDIETLTGVQALLQRWNHSLVAFLQWNPVRNHPF